MVTTPIFVPLGLSELRKIHITYLIHITYINNNAYVFIDVDNNAHVFIDLDNKAYVFIDLETKYSCFSKEGINKPRFSPNCIL